ncbi:MAG TPA: hypothetical protein VHX59_01095 [Mycobacteriales bacterium]|jgi:hypothetical protein|nr:hypothetical protein [Mycobacteriales bacterium]
MKISASVPDDLWESARDFLDADSTSGVVQEALRRVLADRTGGPSYAEVPAGDPALDDSLEDLRDRLIDEARELFQRGYRKGVELIHKLDWQQLQWVAEQGVVRAAEAVGQAVRDLERGDLDRVSVIRPALLIEYLGRYADMTGSTEWAPSTVEIEGMDRAFQDVWKRVRGTGATGAHLSKQQRNALQRRGGAS